MRRLRLPAVKINGEGEGLGEIGSPLSMALQAHGRARKWALLKRGRPIAGALTKWVTP